jgi:hypothetical protein
VPVPTVSKPFDINVLRESASPEPDSRPVKSAIALMQPTLVSKP